MATTTPPVPAGNSNLLTPKRLRRVSILLSGRRGARAVGRTDRALVRRRSPQRRLRRLPALAPRPYQPAPVRIVDIDEASLARLGQWPWPRVKVAKLISELRELGASAIASDFIFAEPDRTSPAVARRRMAQGARSRRAAQQAARTTTRRWPTSSGAATWSRPSRSPRSPAARRRCRRRASSASAPRIPLVVSRYKGAVVSLPPLQEAAAGNGAVNFSPDRDGVVRRVPLLVERDGIVYPGLVAEALRVSSRRDQLHADRRREARAGPEPPR